MSNAWHVLTTPQGYRHVTTEAGDAVDGVHGFEATHSYSWHFTTTVVRAKAAAAAPLQPLSDAANTDRDSEEEEKQTKKNAAATEVKEEKEGAEEKEKNVDGNM